MDPNQDPDSQGMAKMMVQEAREMRAIDSMAQPMDSSSPDPMMGHLNSHVKNMNPMKEHLNKHVRMHNAKKR